MLQGRTDSARLSRLHAKFLSIGAPTLRLKGGERNAGCKTMVMKCTGRTWPVEGVTGLFSIPQGKPSIMSLNHIVLRSKLSSGRHFI